MTDADRLAMSPELCDSIRVMAESDLGATDWPAETILRLLATIAALRAPTIVADARPPSSEGVEAIAAERRRQVTVEGWSPEHDDAHDEGDLLAAAICYAEDAFWGPRGDPKPRDGWPWDAKWWKPKGKLRNLARAGALIAAEFDRTVRQARHGASDRLEAALATPSPTIAAPSTSQADDAALVEVVLMIAGLQENAGQHGDAHHLRKAAKRIEALSATPRQVSIAAPSPSNDCADKSAVIARVEALESFGAMVELTTLLGTREMVTGAEVEVVSAAQLRAALAERGANDKHE